MPDAKAALEGARDIIAEGIAENADLLGELRSHMGARRRSTSKVVEGKEGDRREVLRLFRSFRTLVRPVPATARSPCCAAGTRTSSTLDIDAPN